MNKVSDVLAKRFSQDPLEIYFSKHPPGASINKLSLLYQKVFKPIATGKVRDENINFESNRTSSMSEKNKQNNPYGLQRFQAAIRYLAIIPTQKAS